jgi:DNA-binding CsgD family transcriptional regulator
MHPHAFRLIGLFYEAAVTPSLWQKALAEFADAAQADDARIIALDKSAGGAPILAVAGARGTSREFRAVHDPLIPKMLREPQQPGALMLSQEYLPPDELARSDYCQEPMIPGGVQHQAAWVLEDSVEIHAVIELVRGGPEGFERARLCELQEVIGHLQRALRMSLQLVKAATAEVRWRHAVEQTSVMCLIVDANARLLDQSAATAALLSSPSHLRIQAGRLATSTVEQTQRLHQQIALAAGGLGGGSARLSCTLGSLHLQIAPAGVCADNPFSARYGQCAMVLIRQRRHRRPPSVDTLRVHLHCSLAEAHVAAALAAGHSPQTIAYQREVSINTVRAQVRSLFACTRTSRIGKLVALLGRL